ncbi:MAG: DUF4430 domain-containing protein [Clostridiaceae bacterium]|nr:DUF4430 domain-containing protein [Clostridiaceae bacterium]
MKKVFSIILVLIFALCLLSSCSNKAEESQSLDRFVYVEVLDNEGKPMIEKSKVGFFEGITAYDALKKACDEKKVQLKVSGFGNMIYVTSIGNLSEKDKGPMSGWIFMVNGDFPDRGIDQYKLNKEDVVVLKYTTGEEFGEGE